MKTKNEKDLGFSSVQINSMYLSVIRTDDISIKGIIYWVFKEEFASAEAEDEIHLYYPKIENSQIQNEDEGQLTGFPGLLEKKKNLTVIE